MIGHANKKNKLERVVARLLDFALFILGVGLLSLEGRKKSGDKIIWEEGGYERK